MKIVQQLTRSRHGGIVFINSAAASRKDMTLAVAIMSEDKSELAILECEAPEVNKLKALLAAGFVPSLAKLDSGNYFICQKSEVGSVTESVDLKEANVSTDLPNNSVSDPAPVKQRRPVVYKRKVIGMYNEETDELEIDEEYHSEDHDYLLLEPCDESPYWEIEDEGLDKIMAMKDQPAKEPKQRVNEACDMAIAASNFLNY